MKKIYNAIIICLTILVSLNIFSSCIGDYSSTSSKSATCQVCHKTYTYEIYDDYNYHIVRCIRMTNMCKRCYSDFCAVHGMKPTDY